MQTKIIEQKKSELIGDIEKGIVLSPAKVNITISEEYGELEEFIKNWYSRVFNFPFQEFYHADALEYIFHDANTIQVIRHSGITYEATDYTQDDFELALSIMCLRNSIAWNHKTPFASFNIKIEGNSFRASLSHASLSSEHKSKLFLRPLTTASYPLDSFKGDLNLIKEMIASRDNILIAGATGSGKTSFINSVLGYTEINEHLVILEDTFELISPHKNTTRFVSKAQKAYSLEAYMTYAMRMSPKRIVLGELRSKEVEAYLLALNSGHSGCISTIHANSAQDALHRLALLYQVFSTNSLSYETIINLISKSIQKVVFLEDRKVTQIIRILGSDGSDIFHENLLDM